MNRKTTSHLTFTLMTLLSAALCGCKGSSNPYDEFDILPLEEAPRTPEAPDADASIAADDRDAAVEEQEDQRADDAAHPIYFAQVRLRSRTIQAGETLVVDIRLAASDGSEVPPDECVFRTYLGGQELFSEGGYLHFEKVCETPGSYYLQGVIYVDTPTGTEKYPYNESYTVE